MTEAASSYHPKIYLGPILKEGDLDDKRAYFKVVVSVIDSGGLEAHLSRYLGSVSGDTQKILI